MKDQPSSNTQAVFQALYELDTEAQKEYLADLQARDPELYKEVQHFLDDLDDESGFLQQPAAMYADEVAREAFNLEDQGEAPWIDQTLGHYRLTEKIGEGGMATVYAAERIDGQFEQRVAIKLIKRGMDTDSIVRRFMQERSILAQLIHPNIAQLYDGDVTEDGLPYFVMELIEGEDIIAYSTAKKLSIDERLSLFEQVCDAIQYAHQNLIVHRDLKPSNIIVTKQGTVKLLDFGIAKLLDDSDSGGRLTRTEVRVMTPAYAAPEQITGEAIRTTTDIYGLGLILYELLTGHRR